MYSFMQFMHDALAVLLNLPISLHHILIEMTIPMPTLAVYMC